MTSAYSLSNPVEVVYFDSTMSGAPSLGGAGTAIAVLDACLVNGWGSVTLTSLVVSGGVATATRSSGHNFTDYAVILIAGATPADLNGRKRITYVSSTQFTFEATGIANQTATGTIIVQRAPAGWSKTTLSTNEARYTKNHGLATPIAFYINDTVSSYATIAGYETVGGNYFYGNTTYYNYPNTYLARSSTNKPWIFLADGRSFYFFTDNGAAGNTWFPNGLIDLTSFITNDTYGCVLIGGINTSGSHHAGYIDFSTYSSMGCTLARSYSGTPSVGGIFGGQRGLNQNYSGYGTGLINDVSCVTDGKYHVTPIEIWEYKETPRGIQPGAYVSLHDFGVPAHGTIITNPNTVRTPHLLGRRLLAMKFSSNTQMAYDLTGPWYQDNLYYGAYRIRGTAKKLGAVGRYPLALYARDTGKLIKKTLSAADGSYLFNNLAYLLEGYIVAEYDGDITDPLNAAIADLVTPEAMP